MRPRTFLWAALLAALASPLLATDLDGTWRMDMPRAGGVVLHNYFVLHREGDALTGKIVINNSVDLPMKDVRLDGDDVQFDTAWNQHFRLRPDGDRLHVTIRYFDGNTSDGWAVRADPSEAQPPPKAPVPALHRVPANGLALTPPMGWNSWNHFAERVDDKIVRQAADALVSSGLAAAGYVYINIDDCWESHRDAQGRIVTNTKFPDMKALAAYVHGKGLKLGIYSSPGPKTCGGYEGSFGHEEDDARTYAEWGIDYLKYDWCSAGRVYSNDDLQAVYQKMGEILEHSGRPIVYSLCEYGMGDVWKWGPDVGANLWRTTGDIQDNWKSMTEIGFNQNALAPYAAPGHWNDPDMLEVGNGGMTATEYRTHFTLWCMLSAPLMAGNDLSSMSRETIEILANREVIALDQDPLGRQGTRLRADGGVEIWTKPLAGGDVAVALFNRGEAEATASVQWSEIGLPRPAKVRDLWRHADVRVSGDTFSAPVPAHGVIALRVPAGRR